jgi:predicted nucleic acid-binding protein
VSKQKVCYDTNLLVDLLLQRQRVSILENRDIKDDIYATSYSISTVYYIANQKQKVNNQEFKKFIDRINIIPVDGEIMQKALELAHDNDLEDAIQVAACLRAGIKTFATADNKLVKLYSHVLNIDMIGK